MHRPPTNQNVVHDVIPKPYDVTEFDRDSLIHGFRWSHPLEHHFR